MWLVDNIHKWMRTNTCTLHKKQYRVRGKYTPHGWLDDNASDLRMKPVDSDSTILAQVTSPLSWIERAHWTVLNALSTLHLMSNLFTIKVLCTLYTLAKWMCWVHFCWSENCDRLYSAHLKSPMTCPQIIELCNSSALEFSIGALRICTQKVSSRKGSLFSVLYFVLEI